MHIDTPFDRGLMLACLALSSSEAARAAAAAWLEAYDAARTAGVPAPVAEQRAAAAWAAAGGATSHMQQQERQTVEAYASG